MAVITEKIGDIFSAPAHSILIHACNAKGIWGAGVALAFKQKYPQAFRIYAAHCNPKSHIPKNHRAALAGTALLIPPSSSPSSSSPASTHWIACLFTSMAYGRGRDSEAQILLNTRCALADLAMQLEALKGKGAEAGAEAGGNEGGGDSVEGAGASMEAKGIEKKETKQEIGKSYAVPINSGKFGVPWSRTKPVLEAGEIDITVMGTDPATFI